jgi:hypothetical protein
VTPGRNTVDGGAIAGRPTILRSLQWWPALAGAGFAAFVALDLFTGGETGRDLGPVVAASGLVYLAAAALRKPFVAWPAFFVSVVVITIAKLGWTEFDATWILLAFAALLAIYGLATGAARPAGGLPLQTIAMLGFGAVAAIALFIDATAGAYMVAAGLLAHAAWDAYHHRTNTVVVRSMAEFCFVLDVLLAVAILIVTIRA